MEMLVTKFSKGKYRNEGELFSEPISKDNVKLMGEMIALQLFRTRKKHYCRIADKLYADFYAPEADGFWAEDSDGLPYPARLAEVAAG